MRGIILAGGTGSRLKPLTDTTNKHLLPVGDKLMIEYPIETLKQLGVPYENMAIVSNVPEQFEDFLKSKDVYNLIKIIKQEGVGGIPSAIKAAEDFVGIEPFAAVLGDNIIREVKLLPNCIPRIFITPVTDPSRYGVLELKGNKFKVREKPKRTSSHWGVMGLYVFDKRFFEFFDKIKPSKRGETEIADVINQYIGYGEWTFTPLFCFAKDAGTFESLEECDEEVKGW